MVDDRQPATEPFHFSEMVTLEDAVIALDDRMDEMEERARRIAIGVRREQRRQIREVEVAVRQYLRERIERVHPYHSAPCLGESWLAILDRTRLPPDLQQLIDEDDEEGVALRK